MTHQPDMEKKLRLLFICLGNICRSPAANAVMQKLVDETGKTNKYFIDSAGIGAWHVGQLPDKRMRQHAQLRGYNVNHIARQFNAAHDFDSFDYIIVMDEENYEDISTRARSGADMNKVLRMASFLKAYPNDSFIPDPYYSGAEGFEHVLDLLEDACAELLRKLEKQ